MACESLSLTVIVPLYGNNGKWGWKKEWYFTMNQRTHSRELFLVAKDIEMKARPDREVLGQGSSEGTQLEYILVPSYLRTCFPQLSYADKWLYICLLDLYSESKETSYSFRKLERETGISKGSLCRAIPRLRQAGLIRATKRTRDDENRHEVWHIIVIVPTAEQIKVAIATGQLEKIEKKYPLEEIDRVAFQVRRAEEAGVPATLTMEEWLETLDYFNWGCAYCHGSYEVIEHFIPIAIGGGTTYQNCVPACVSCNNRKDTHHPLLIPSSLGMTEAIGRVLLYLEYVREEVTA